MGAGQPAGGDPEPAGRRRPPDAAGLVALAERAARSAGDLVRRDQEARDRDRPRVDATKSSPTDVVTSTDRAAESLLRQLLAGARPDDGVLGEEDGLRPGTSGVTWVLDPIDGTVNYLYRLPAFAVSVAAVTGDPRRPGGWSALAGCVHNPVTGQTWTAGAGLGAREDGRSLRLPDPPEPAQALVGTGFGYIAERRLAQARVLVEVLPLVRDIRRFGSAALDLCAVASGRLDAYYEQGLNVWDVAAAALVVTEAGGVVRGLDELPCDTCTVVAGAVPLVDRLAGLLAAAAG